MITPAPEYQAIVHLHERGYTDDFKSVSKGVLWVQQKIVLPESEFSIIDYHRTPADHSRKRNTIILGLLLTSFGVKGILICHYSTGMGARYAPKKVNGTFFTKELQQNPAYPSGII